MWQLALVTCQSKVHSKCDIGDVMQRHVNFILVETILKTIAIQHLVVLRCFEDRKTLQHEKDKDQCRQNHINPIMWRMGKKNHRIMDAF